jgi:hypothetical protein
MILGGNHFVVLTLVCDRHSGTQLRCSEHSYLPFKLAGGARA